VSVVCGTVEMAQGEHVWRDLLLAHGAG